MRTSIEVSIVIVLAIPDLHAPWLHPDAVCFLAELKRIHRPDVVVLLGDEAEAHRFSDHLQSPNLPGPKDELLMAREALRPIMKLFRDARVCHSNHMRRIYKRAALASIPDSFMRGVGEILDAPSGWQWADWWDIDGVHYRHGDGYTGAQGALKCAEKMRRSCVIGHIHSFAGIQYSQGVYDRVFGMNAGALVDPAAECFSYGKYLAQRPVLGAAIVKHGIPHFVPLDSIG